jgi:hypothetical protein
MPVRLTDNFKPIVENCTDVVSAGSVVYFSPLPPCADQPVEHDLVIDAPLPTDPVGTNLLGGTRIRVRINSISSGSLALASFNVFRGTKITFASGVVATVAENFRAFGNAVPGILLDVEPLSANLATGTLSSFYWSVGELSSATDLSLSFSDSVQDSSDLLTSFQASQSVTATELQTQISFRLRCDDIAYHAYILPAYKRRAALYVSYWQGDVTSCGHWIFGRAYISNLSFQATTKDFLKGSFNLLWQSPYAYGTRRQELTTAQRTAFDQMCLKSGLTTIAGSNIVPIRV